VGTVGHDQLRPVGIDAVKVQAVRVELKLKDSPHPGPAQSDYSRVKLVGDVDGAADLRNALDLRDDLREACDPTRSDLRYVAAAVLSDEDCPIGAQVKQVVGNVQS